MKFVQENEGLKWKERRTCPLPPRDSVPESSFRAGDGSMIKARSCLAEIMKEIYSFDMSFNRKEGLCERRTVLLIDQL